MRCWPRYRSRLVRRTDGPGCLQRCYNVKDDPPDRTWHCRRCEFALEQQNPSKSSEEESEDAEDSGGDDSSSVLEDAVPDLANTTFPSLDSLPETHKFAVLHRDPNFASVFRFLQRFRHLGLRVPADLSLHVSGEVYGGSR
jgi:hypothetical protein